METTKIIISKDDIRELTGYSCSKYQKQWLMDNGIIFLVAADGSPRVLYAELVNKMCDVAPKYKNKKKEEPNFSSIK